MNQHFYVEMAPLTTHKQSEVKVYLSIHLYEIKGRQTDRQTDKVWLDRIQGTTLHRALQQKGLCLY